MLSPRAVKIEAKRQRARAEQLVRACRNIQSETGENQGPRTQTAPNNRVQASTFEPPMTQNNDLLALLRAAAEENGGRPPGEVQFLRRSRLTRKALWVTGYDTYGAACEAAGLQANTFSSPQMSDDDLFRPLASLTRASAIPISLA